ncbi:ARM repeat-containing protein [Amniculicola lignicola CBS 123094]|uniref:ARM repeat-containing protein n=1 Tax=Amniculicola lignicola CBS 123094 TaxID=1392246 RepID=A0A6A5WYM6_9PLEO|nr:ARM repeat-containing protein [Amniculicola lignicola CBS 123094]
MSGTPFMDQTSGVFLTDLQAFLDQDSGNGTEQDTNLALSRIPERVRGFSEQGEEEIYVKALEIIGTAFGQKKQWHSPLWEFFLDHASRNLGPSNDERNKQYLRIVGNLVADNDANREIATPSLKAIASCLESEKLRTTALAVLLNLCNDYEPAQAEAANIRLDATIANLLAAEKVPEEAIEHATDLLSWTTDKLSPDQMKDDMSVVVFENILTTALSHDEESYFDYLAIITHYLQDPEFQQKMTSPQLIEKMVDLVLDYESRLTPGEIGDSFQALRAKTNSATETPEDTTILFMVQLVNALSGVSSSDAFIGAFNLQSPLIDKLKSKLQAPYSPSAVCACVILGNLATSDNTTIAMAKDSELLEHLLGVLDEQDKPALLFAAAGLIRHLAFPEVNRTILGEAGFPEKMCVLISGQDPSVRGEAAAVLAKLVSNNEYNIKKISNCRKPDKAVSELHPDVVMLWFLVDEALRPSAPLPSSSMRNAGIEIGKVVVAILRWLRRSEQTEEIKEMTERMSYIPPVGRPVARLFRQRFYADARSEGLLGLGLLAQDSDGADVVVSEMKFDDGLLDAVKEFALEQRKDDKDAGRDFQNAIVMLHGLLKYPPTDMGAELKEKVEEVQKELSKLMV